MVEIIVVVNAQVEDRSLVLACLWIDLEICDLPAKEVVGEEHADFINGCGFSFFFCWHLLGCRRWVVGCRGGGRYIEG